jgi:cell pole-organizing protein PopZ
MRHESEPSVEEILASIKKVIARDHREQVIDERRRRVQDALEAAAEEEEEEDVLELGAEAELVDAGDEEESLIPEDSRASMRESLAALAMLAEPGVPPQIVRSGETSLEGLTREMLRPMLAEWLDKNLPGMVEKLVAAEIARIAGKKG